MAVATCAFYDSQGRVLCQERKGISKHGEEWSFFGGKVEFGEWPKQGLMREIGEELGYMLTNYVLIGNYTSNYNEKASASYHLYAAPFPGFDKFELKEGSGMKLFTLEHVRELNFMPSGSAQIFDDLEK